MATVGTQVSSYPFAIPSFTAQTESSDPPSEDPDIAEGRDANLWSAEIEALGLTLGVGGRAQFILDVGTPAVAIGSLKVQVAGALVTMPLTAALALTAAVPNFIYANLDTTLYVASTVGFPTDATRFVPIATWDGLAPSAVDARPVNLAWGSPLFTAEGLGVALNASTAKGQQTVISMVEGFSAAISGATVTFASLIPAGCLVLGVTSLVTTAITGATDFDLGDGVDIDAFGAALPIALSSASDLTDSTLASPAIYTAATDVIATANGGAFTAGDLRVAVHYLSLTAPTS